MKNRRQAMPCPHDLWQRQWDSNPQGLYQRILSAQCLPISSYRHIIKHDLHALARSTLHVVVSASSVMFDVPRYPTFTGICDLVLFRQLWVSRFSVRLPSNFSTKIPIGGLVAGDLRLHQPFNRIWQLLTDQLCTYLPSVWLWRGCQASYT